MVHTEALFPARAFHASTAFCELFLLSTFLPHPSSFVSDHTATMTEEQQEDVKPKINLVVDFEGQSESHASRDAVQGRASARVA